MYTNSANPDETPRNMASDQGPHCLAGVSSYLINLSRESVLGSRCLPLYLMRQKCLAIICSRRLQQTTF